MKIKLPEGYNIVGNLTELENSIYGNAKIATTFRDVISVLDKDKTNYVTVGYGSTLNNAFQNADIERQKCRLMHIFVSPKNIPTIKDLHNFIIGNEGIIFGLSIDDNLYEGVKIVILYN